MSYTSFHLSSLRRPAFGLALLTCAGLAAAPAHAQIELDLGVSGTTVSGTATVTDTGTTASGTYTYNDGGSGTPLNEQTSFAALIAYGDSTANVSGGSIQYLTTDGGGTIDLFGTGFTETFEGDPQGSILQYNVTGTLQDGTAINATYDFLGGNLIFSSPVPEASSVMSLGILLVLGLGGLAVSARRKAQAAA